MRDYVQVPLKNLLNVSKIATILYFSFSPTYKSFIDYHDFWELIYVDKGAVTIQAGEREFPLRCQEVILHYPNVPHRISCNGEHGANVFIISFSCSSAAMKHFSTAPLEVPNSLRSLISALINEGTKNYNCTIPLKPLPNAPIGGEQMIRMMLQMLLIQLLRVSGKKTENDILPSVQSLDNHLAANIMAYLDSHVYDRVTIKELCEVFHYGKSRLCDIFKDNTGKTIIGYYTEQKIEVAKELMRGGKAVRQTAALLQFDTPQYFSRVFKTYTGMPPHEFRNSLLFNVDVKVKKRQLNKGKKIQEN